MKDGELENTQHIQDTCNELLAACEKALAFIKSKYPREHGQPDVGEAWGALERAIEKAKCLQCGRAI
jgi:hypothetical protein